MKQLHHHHGENQQENIQRINQPVIKLLPSILMGPSLVRHDPDSSSASSFVFPPTTLRCQIHP